MTQVDTGAPPGQKARIRRSNDDKVVAGVCGGLGHYFNTDPLWFRVGFVAVTLAGGAGILFYIVAWIVMPKARTGETPPSRQGDQGMPVATLAGLVLTGIGLMILAENLLPWFADVMWPVAVVAAGLGLIFLGARR